MWTLTDRREVIFHIMRLGMAWFYRFYAKELGQKDATAYDHAEAQARKEKRGLWADPAPTPPWDFRRSGRTARAPGVKPAATATGEIFGNRNSKIYHLPACPVYNKVAEKNRVPFASEVDAVKAGYRKAKNCPQ
jgi:micrococcal nuclease